VGDLVMQHIHHPAKTPRKIIDILRGVGITPSTNPINVRAHPHES